MIVKLTWRLLDMQQKTILIVDDEPAIVKGLKFNLEQQEGYVIDSAYDGEESLQIFDP